MGWAGDRAVDAGPFAAAFIVPCPDFWWSVVFVAHFVALRLWHSHWLIIRYAWNPGHQETEMNIYLYMGEIQYIAIMMNKGTQLFFLSLK